MIPLLIALVICSPLLIIGIIRFVNLFSYRASNIEKTEATLKRTDYTSSHMMSRSDYTYSYIKMGIYVFEIDGNEYEFIYSSDRDHGYLPEKITACYPKGKPHKAYAEGNPPLVKSFFNAVLFIFLYGIATATVFIVAEYFFG